MGICGSGEKGSGAPKEKNMIKVLTLGVSGCGKSTFAKQMKIIHDQFQEFEIFNYKTIVHRNVTAGIREIAIYIAENEDLKDYSENMVESLNFFKDSSNVELKGDVVEKAKKIWDDDSFKGVFEKIKFNIQFPHVDYFLKELDRIVEENYLPSNEDIVRCRQATIGATRMVFRKDKFLWTIIDVGGHQPERSKWGQVVKDGINAMIYFVALDDYATESGEEKGKTKMEISKLVWEEVVNSDIFSGECTLLFLNKVDLFREQMTEAKQYKSFKKAYPDYSGDQDPDQALEYVKQQFLELSTKRPPSSIYTHYTCAIDTEQMNVVWEALQENIIRQRLAASGLPVFEKE
jgi:GTPase SAR1 family protein